MTLELDHRTLSEMGAKWCKKSASQNGHGCNISIVEGCANKENADVIGFRHSHPAKGSVLIEVKVSRSDFLSDKKKPHRKNPSLGMGKWRYFLCPENLITPKDLKNHPKWGLLYGYPNGRIKVIVGPLADKPNWQQRETCLKQFAFDEYNIENEQVLLIKSLTRFEELDDMIKLQRLNNKVSNQSMRLSDENRELRSKNSLLVSHVKRKNDQLLQAKVALNDHGVDHTALIELTYSTLYDIHDLKDQKYHLQNSIFNANKDCSKEIAVIDAELAHLEHHLHLQFIDSCRIRYKLDIGISFARLVQNSLNAQVGRELILTALNNDTDGHGQEMLEKLIQRQLIEHDESLYWFSESFKRFSFSYIYDEDYFRKMNK